MEDRPGGAPGAAVLPLPRATDWLRIQVGFWPKIVGRTVYQINSYAVIRLCDASERGNSFFFHLNVEISRLNDIKAVSLICSW